MATKKVSVIISARNEFPQIVFTIQSIINDLETFLSPKDFEIILVDNGSTDNTQDPNIKGTSDFLRCRGMFNDRVLRILFDPVAGNVSARNKGVEIAQGEYIFFSDAHMSYKFGSFKAMIKAIDESGGIVHPAIDWLGAYPSEPGYQYTMKLGEKIWGTWTKYKVADTWFAIPMCGHCCLGMKREQFEKFRGYNPYFRCYGGGEMYLDLKWWLMGGKSVCEPSAVGYHLSAGRGYSYHNDDLMHNMMLCAYTLGGLEWAERTFITYLNKPGVRKEKVKELYRQALEEGKEDYEWIRQNAIMSLDDILDNPCWDKVNMERHGKKLSYITIFHEWLKGLIDPEAIEIYKTSPFQRQLDEKIIKKWPHLIYRGRTPVT